MKNVIILYGGKSCEHDISIITACLAKGYFANYNAYCVYLNKDNAMYLVPNNYSPAMHVNGKFTQKAAFLTGERALAVLKRNRIAKRIPIDVVVNCCHGAHGEDGTVAALCGLLNVPVVGSSITSSAVAMDKVLTKRVLNSLGVPTVRGFEVNAQDVDRLAELAEGYGFPIIVKPNTLGSSIGVAVCKDVDELRQNVATALTYDNRVLCEVALTDFCELNCSAMRVDGEVVCSRVDLPVTANDILTFEDKYVSWQPADVQKTSVEDEVIENVRQLTKLVYTAIGYAGVIRVDYLYNNASKRLYVNEINSIPGSLAYGLWNDKYSLTDYGDALIEQVERDYAEQSRLTTVFNSSVLSQCSGVKYRKK